MSNHIQQLNGLKEFWSNLGNVDSSTPENIQSDIMSYLQWLEQQQREIERLKTTNNNMWECPDCGFRFDACHGDDTQEGGYSCPVCEEEEQRKVIADKDREIERLNKALDQIHTDSTDAWAVGYALRVQSKALSPKEEETTYDNQSNSKT